MKGIVKTVLIVGALFVVGMVGLKTMDMIRADSTSHARQGHWTVDDFGREHFVPAVSPGVAVAVLPGQPAIADEVWPVDTSTQWGAPAQIQVNVHDSWIDAASSFAGVILLIGMIAILFIVIRSMRRGRTANPSDETALIHELARRAQDLAQRMEALETILLDRTRATR